ncbi:MAG: sugar ABC transporter permease [Caldilinea sp.]|uniref:carbohydrate ABC transporter permease n=1 Tax=Caldilinea sp. TaxID=2293560 RepID=UPI002BFC7856|nr:sugar ABC transporter permease [Anaerolineales bacterium]HQY92821.1 sugar ABC transporter permease [Caldilinea sp.]HRA64689.1 sugar ABC transporter permease [Caldilinea sp.]
MQQIHKSRFTLAQKEDLWALFFIAPWLVGFVLFTAGPMLLSFYFSLTRYNIVDPPIFTGFENYVRAFVRDPLFWHSLRVTIYYGALALPLGLIAGFSLSLLLNQKVPGVSVWRTIYFLPSVIAGVAVAIVWSRIFSPQIGILNPFLESNFGIKGPGWFTDPDWAVPGLVIMSLWGVGGGIIIYLAGLQGIPTSLFDAAKVDGANVLQRFRHVTLPMMTPVLFYTLVLGLIGAFQYFTEVYVISGGSGGPQRATLFYNLYLYQNAFKYNEMGYASALAWVLFLVVLALTLLVFRSSVLWVYYEGEVRRR